MKRIDMISRLGRIAMPLLFGAVAAMAQDPPRSQYRTTVLMRNLSDPTQIAFLPDGRIYVARKQGVVLLYDPVTKQTTTAATINTANVREDGLHGLVLDPNFATNRRVYMIYSARSPGDTANVVARLTANATTGAIDTASRQILLKIPYTLNSSTAEHNDGILTFGPGGNLFIGLPDNTQNVFSGNGQGSAPRDPTRLLYDAQRSAANTNDLRGKILRIHPEENGTYTIPTGNLWEYINQPSFNPNWNSAVDSVSKVRREIYAFGLRHPFRVTYDSANGYLYWAEPGPNATADNATTGPRGYEEVNMAKSPGYYGWPYCIANNFCYTQYNYSTNTGGATYVATALQNTSVNNTGIRNLPPPRPAQVWYPYNSTGTAFPMFGSGSVNTGMLGPVYHYNPSQPATRLPVVFDRHIFIVEWSRSLVFVAPLDTAGNVGTPRSFWNTTDSTSNAPIDIKVGPDGSLYFLNWVGTAYTNNSGTGTLTKLEYTGPQTAIEPQIRGRGKLEARLVVAGLQRSVEIPAGAVGAEFVDLRGANVWSYRRASSQKLERLQLRSDLRGVLHMKLLFR